MLTLIRWIICVFPLFCFSQAYAAESLDKIVLQLPWYHQFQFAGYYAAVEQGYYKDAGLDVTLKSGRPKLCAADEVVAGRAEYGVGRAGLLLHYLKGKPLVALAAVFQHSASVMLARQDSGIYTPQDMMGRRVMLLEGDDAAAYHATFKSVGITPGQINIIPSSYEIDDLIRGETDVFNAYISNEPFFLEQQGIPYTIIKPSDYGIDFYGDTLFTSEGELAAHPDRVKAFRYASMRGWEYALAHHEEMIELLINKYKVTKTKSHLRYEADAIEKLILPELVEIGHMLPERWQHMAETFTQLGMIDVDARDSLKDFIYIPPREPDYAQLRRIAVSVALVLIFASIIMLFYFNRRLQRVLAVRTAELTRSERLFREIYNNIHSGVAIYEAVDNGNDFIIKDLNPAGLKHSQVERGSILNKSVKEVFPGVVDLGLFAVFQRVWQMGTPEHQQTSLYEDDRVKLWVENYVCKLPSGEIVAVYDDMTERHEAKRKQDFLQKRLEALWKISSMLDFDMDSICDAILEEIVGMTESKYGIYCFMDEHEQVLKLYSCSNDKVKGCLEGRIPKDSLEKSTLWENAVRDRKPCITNDYQQESRNKEGSSAGNVPFTRAMSVPILLVDRIVAVATVVDKVTDYSEEDMKQMVAFLMSVQILLDRKRTELAITQDKEV